jgi:LysM repeat protein
VVKRGDTLSAIAARFNVSLASPGAANPQLGSDQLIVIGSTLPIPPR